MVHDEQYPLLGKVAMVTGGSRGIGAAVVERLAADGADVVITFRNKLARAERVGALVRELGRRALVAEADMTVPHQMDDLMRLVELDFGRLDLLILNASGGLEKDRPADYAMQLNLTAQARAVDLALPLMPPSGRIVFVTSHMAHFYRDEPLLYREYEPIAASKHAGEQELQARLPMLAERDVSLVVVSGDVIEGTITPKLIERLRPGGLDRYRQEVGGLPTVEEFARAIARAAGDPNLSSGATVYVGNTRAS
jgi:3-oxoacyl-[acyl-carrier protein] reductase